MRNRKSVYDRREFLKNSLTLTAGNAMVNQLVVKAIPSSKTIDFTSETRIPTRILGKTGVKLPILACGGVAFTHRWADYFGVPKKSISERIQIIRYAYEKGIRYFDTSRGYQESEGIIGEALRDVRSKVYIATKLMSFAYQNVRRNLETSLMELKTEYVDCLQLHGPAVRYISFERAMRIHEELSKLKQEGLIRFIGLTGHDSFKKMHQLINTGGFDQLLIAYGYFRKAIEIISDEEMMWRDTCITKAHQMNMGIIAMKIMAANVLGHNSQNIVPNYHPLYLKQLPAAAIRWALQNRNIHLLNIGVSLPTDIDNNISTFIGDLTFTEHDKELLADFSRLAYQSDNLQKGR